MTIPFLSLLPRWTAVAAVGGLTASVAGAGGVIYLLHARPVLHIASSAGECVNAPDHVASLFTDDQSTQVRISNLDYSDLKVLRQEPAATLPGMFNSLLALSSDSRRLAYVTADNELMDDAHIQYVDVGSPDTVHALAQVPRGLAPVRPAWSPNADVLAYVVGRPLSALRPAGFEVWTVRSSGNLPPQKVSELPLDVFAHGHSASLCFTSSGQIGLLQGVESSQGQPGPLPLPASAARTVAPSPTARPGSPCGVPVFSQNDPSWQTTIMQLGGDPIGGFGCALTSTTMLLNYFGAVLSPVDLNACLGSAADPIVWASAPGCTSGRVQGGVRTDFSWDGLDSYLKGGKPVIVGMVRGQTGMHFVVVTQGGGGEADDYTITDPWDGSTTKTLGSYTNVGYNPLWLVSYDGSAKNCARLVPGTPAVQGVHDGQVTRGGVTVTVPSGGGGKPTPPSPPSATPSATPSLSPSASPSASATPSASPSATPAAGPTPTPGATPGGGPILVRLKPGQRYTASNEGIYLIITCSGSPPRCRMVKFTIDRTPPVLSLHPLNVHVGPVHTMAFRPAVAPAVIALDAPGQVSLAAVDTLSGVSSVEYRADGSDWKQYTDDVRFGRPLVFAVGMHTIGARAWDLAGNSTVLPDQQFQVLNVSPSPSPSPSASPSPTPTGQGPTAPPPTSPPNPTAPPTTPPTTPPPPPPPPFSASASVTPTNVTTTGCPVTFTFTGTITYTGSGPIKVSYMWLRSDGATMTPISLSFSGPGSQQVPDTWTLSSPLNTPINRWEQLELLTSPAVLSNQAAFTLDCIIIP